jgi:hypothetical protein
VQSLIKTFTIIKLNLRGKLKTEKPYDAKQTQNISGLRFEIEIQVISCLSHDDKRLAPPRP